MRYEAPNPNIEFPLIDQQGFFDIFLNDDHFFGVFGIFHIIIIILVAFYQSFHFFIHFFIIKIIFLIFLIFFLPLPKFIQHIFQLFDFIKYFYASAPVQPIRLQKPQIATIIINKAINHFLLGIGVIFLLGRGYCKDI